MRKKYLFIMVGFLLVSVFLSFSAKAISLDDFDKELLIKVYKNAESKDIEYMARLGLESEEIALVLYYYSNSGRKLNERELRDIVKRKKRLEDFHLYFGLPPIFFEDEMVKFRHPFRERRLPPLNVKKYDKTYNFKHGYEKLKVRGHNYEYHYQNKKDRVEEKIDIKKMKYEYHYRDRRMIEKMEVHLANHKYNYYYKNRRTGRVIKREGRGRPLDKEELYRVFKEKYERNDEGEEDEDSGFRFEVKIDIDVILD